MNFWGVVVEREVVIQVGVCSSGVLLLRAVVVRGIVVVVVGAGPRQRFKDVDGKREMIMFLCSGASFVTKKVTHCNLWRQVCFQTLGDQSFHMSLDP